MRSDALQLHWVSCTLEDTVAIESPFTASLADSFKSRVIRGVGSEKLNPISSEAFLSVLGNRW
jgi:hypothetical protein